MDAEEAYMWGMGLVAVTSVFTFPSLFFITLPYGRHSQPGWGPLVDAPLGWALMEAPSPLAFAAAYFLLPHPGAQQPIPLMLLAFWTAWYIYRGPVYALGMRGRNKKLPWMQVLAGASFTAINGFCNGYAIPRAAHLASPEWAASPFFLLGAALLGAGAWANVSADTALRNLRAPGETGYKIPRGGLFEWVSAPNYLGEMLLWLGWGLAVSTPPAALFFVFTVANLFPRAISHHRWYLDKFPGKYPPGRKAILPYLL